VQVVAPSDADAVPAGQFLQAVEFDLVEYVAGLHSMHDPSPPKNHPGEQSNEATLAMKSRDIMRESSNFILSTCSSKESFFLIYF
jgi:hypothetical protein